ncbi:MAG: DUF5398 family protein [Chlamydiota bacterium]|jgi:hypothetical protein
MYGLEKKEPEQFAFDLEEEIKNDSDKGKKYIELAEKRIEELKTKMRSGQGEEDFDKLGSLLHGYTALRKVLNKIAKS